MASRHMRVPGADENPIVEKELPASRPILEFPVVIESAKEERQRATAILFGMIACSFSCLFVSSVIVAVGPAVFFLMISVGIALFAAKAYFTSQADASKWCIVAAIPFAFLAAIVIRAISLPLLFILTLLFLFFEGFMVSLHYTHWSTTGFMSRARAKRIRDEKAEDGDFRPGSWILGVKNSITSYLSYNPTRIDLPGTWRSSAGSFSVRLLRLFVLIVLLTFSVVFFISSSAVPVGRSLHALGSLNLLLVPLITVGIWLLIAGLIAAGSLVGNHGLAAARFSPDYWPEFVEERTRSIDPQEQESLFLGTVDYDGSPILNPVDQLMRHAWIVGKTGSGKTTYLLAMVDQLVRRGDISIDYLDLKAESFEPLATLQGGIPGSDSPPVREVKTFTLEHEMPSFLFDLFSQQAWKKLPTAQRAALILTSLSLAYSPAYGQSWYRDAAYDVVLYVLTRHPDIKNWGEFAKRIQEAIRHAKPWELSDDVKHDGVHVQLILKRLAALSALNANDSTSKEVRDNAIDLTAGFRKPSYTYFALSASINGLIAGEIGRLYASSLLVAAASMKKRAVRRLLIIDEWQCMVTNELTLLLEQARSLGIGVILANQTTAQLITPDGDLRPIVEGNTSLQAWLHITDDIGREQLRRLGGQEIDLLISKSINSEGQATHTYSEYVTDRVPTTFTSTIGSKDQRYFLRLTDNAGYACYGDLIFVARSYFNQHKKDYEAYCEMPWPDPSKKTLINTEPPRTPPPAPAAGTPVPTPKPPGSDSGKARQEKTNQLGRTRSKKRTPKTPSP